MPPHDITTLPREPASPDIATWHAAWTPCCFHYRGAWRIGIVKGWIRLRDGRLIARIDYPYGGGQPGWHDLVHAVYHPDLILPVDPADAAANAISRRHSSTAGTPAPSPAPQ